MNNTAERLAHAWKNKGATQADVADHISKSVSLVRWKIKNDRFDLGELDVICKTYGISKAWVETGEGDIYYQSANPAVALMNKLDQSDYTVKDLHKAKSEIWNNNDIKVNEAVIMKTIEMYTIIGIDSFAKIKMLTDILREQGNHLKKVK